MADFTSQDLERFVDILEDPDSSSEIREVAEHLVSFYFSRPADTRSADTGDERLRLAARDDLAAFSEYVFGHIPATHHKEIIRALEDPKRLRLVIVAPPNSAKSTYVSLIFPTFMMAKYPNECTIALAESFSQVEKWSQQIKELFEGNTDWSKRLLQVFPESVPNKSSWTKEKLYLQNRTKQVSFPNIFFSGMGSTAIQGSRADLLLCDDITGPEKARSPTELQKQRDDLHSVVIKRLNPEGRMLVICTRWGVDDMVPTFIQDMNFEVLHMPALVEDDKRGCYVDWVPSSSYLRHPEPGDEVEFPQWIPHPDGENFVQSQLVDALTQARAEGFEAEITTSPANMGRQVLRKFLHKSKSQVLWPARFSKEALIQDRNASPTTFRLVQQGDPTGITGDLFKRTWMERYYGRDQTITQLPREVRTFITVDPSVGNAKKKGGGDFFVAAVVAVDRYHNKFVTDVYRDKILPPYQRDEVKRLYEENPEVQAILIETVNYQAALFHELANKGLPVIPLDTKKSKDIRIESSSIFYKQGKVYIPVDAPWGPAFVDEFTQYPRGKHDDQIDAMANLLEWLSLNFDFDYEEEQEVNFEVAE